jgi:hypothetical protein
MHLAEAYRSLARPSSALEPSHPLAGIFADFNAPLNFSERLVAMLIHGFAGPHQASALPRRVVLDVCTVIFKWTCWDSDPGPPPCKGGALPAELQAPACPAKYDLFASPGYFSACCDGFGHSSHLCLVRLTDMIWWACRNSTPKL